MIHQLMRQIYQVVTIMEPSTRKNEPKYMKKDSPLTRSRFLACTCFSQSQRKSKMSAMQGEYLSVEDDLAGQRRWSQHEQHADEHGRRELTGIESAGRIDVRQRMHRQRYVLLRSALPVSRLKVYFFYSIHH